MAFSEIEIARYKKEVGAYVEQKRPPAHIRKELDIGFRVAGQSVEIFEIRPRWNDPEVIIEHPVAKATYVKRQNQWKVFWQRADLKWHGYQPNPTVASLKEFLAVVEADEYACFWG
ncbi:MAG: DUF3024 domain-containing protein [Oceanospirillaceae bacterium]|nr:DUF3024 domain-containing protein [Oceanospirillaceae bacterium]